MPGSRLADIIGSPDIGEGHAKIFAEWSSMRLPNNLTISRLHAKYWGKSMVDDEHEWRKSQPPVAEEFLDDGEDALIAGTEVYAEVMGKEGAEEEEVDVDDDDDDDDITPGCYFLDMSLVGVLRPIWIRADYIRIYDRLEAFYAKVGSLGRAPAAVLTGQPGIGKSVWIYYALRRRLAEKQPVLWRLNEEYYLFVEEGVYKAPPKFGKTSFYSIVWTLVDSDESDGIPGTLIVHGTRLFVIYATSPRKKRWRALTKTVVKITLIMNPWTRKELLRVAESQNISRSKVNDSFDRLGPTPRICVEHTRQEETLEKYEREVDWAIAGMTIDKLQKLFNGALGLDMDAANAAIDATALDIDVSHRICLLGRMDRGDVHSRPVVSPITQSIQTRLATQFRTLERTEQVRQYKLYSKVPDSRATAGVIFEAIGQRRLQDGMALEVIPMVHLSKSRKGSLPRWYSSHIRLSNASLEAFRQQALLHQFTVKVNPTETIEYSQDGPPTILQNVLYVPEATNRNALDSFIWINNLLLIFQFTIGLKHGMKPGLLSFLGQYHDLPSMDCWRFVFVIPPNWTLIFPQPGTLKLRKLPVYSAVIDPTFIDKMKGTQ